MPIFEKKDLEEFTLPVLDAGLVRLCKQKGAHQLLSATYSDGFLIPKNWRITMLYEIAEVYVGLIDGAAWTSFYERYITGAFFLNGKMLRHHENLMIGIFSYELHKHGYIWAGDFRRCVPLSSDSSTTGQGEIP